MELTPGILKSVDSVFHQIYNQPFVGYIVKYRGVVMHDGKNLMFFKTKGNAKAYVFGIIRLMFHQGWHFDKYKDNIKRDTDYDVDYSGTTNLFLPGLNIAEIDIPENKQMMRDIQNELFNQKIITINEVSFPAGPDESKDIPLIQSHRSVVLEWWNDKITNDWKDINTPLFFPERTAKSLSGREIESIYNFLYKDY